MGGQTNPPSRSNQIESRTIDAIRISGMIGVIARAFYVFVKRSFLVSFPSEPKSIAPIVASSDPTTMIITSTVRITVGTDDRTSAKWLITLPA